MALVTAGGSCVPRVSLVSVTVAPGMTPPCASLTVPVTVPVVSCADANDAVHKTVMKATRNTTPGFRTISPPDHRAFGSIDDAGTLRQSEKFVENIDC